MTADKSRTKGWSGNYQICVHLTLACFFVVFYTAMALYERHVYPVWIFKWIDVPNLLAGKHDKFRRVICLQISLLGSMVIGMLSMAVLTPPNKMMQVVYLHLFVFSSPNPPTVLPFDTAQLVYWQRQFTRMLEVNQVLYTTLMIYFRFFILSSGA